VLGPPQGLLGPGGRPIVQKHVGYTQSPASPGIPPPEAPGDAPIIDLMSTSRSHITQRGKDDPGSAEAPGTSGGGIPSLYTFHYH